MSKTTKPNIIWIMCDDLSWCDLGCYGQKKIQTPNVDSLAAGGMKFTQCYSGSTICAPSRSCLMQGLHLGHATVRCNQLEGYRHSLQTDDITVTEVLKSAGYTTGMFGKWGLGLGDQPGLPNDKGFGRFYGYLNQGNAHSYYPEFMWSDREKVCFPEHAGFDHLKESKYDSDGNVIPNGMADPSKAKYSFDLYAAESRKFVRKHSTEPFFMYLPYTIPHGEFIVPNLGPYTNADYPSILHKVWAAMITRMDDEIGRLVKLLKELDIFDNTLIFFCSDNGYSVQNAVDTSGGLPTLDEFFHHTGPFSGEKGDLREGGLRVPMIAHWPGHIPAGSQSDYVWAFWDFLPTAAELAGANPPVDIDGVSILPALLGNPENAPEHKYLYWEYCDDFSSEQAVRLGNWKGFRQHPDQPTELYDLTCDTYERNDLASKYPDIVKRIEEIFCEARIQNPVFPDPGEGKENWTARLKNQGINLPQNA